MNDEIFDAYLLNQLKDTERIEFENKLTQDDNFRKEFMDHKKAIEAIEIQGLESLKAELKILHKEKISSNFNAKYLVIISGIVLLGAAILFLLYSSKSKEKEFLSSQQIYASNYENFPLPGTLRSETKDFMTDTIQNAYKSGDYNQVVQFLESKNDEDLNLHYRLILACSQLNIGQIEAAEENFNFIKNSGNSKFEHSGNWYLGLLYLKNNKVKEAQEIFEDLSKKDSFYASKAKAILLQIKH